MTFHTDNTSGTGFIPARIFVILLLLLPSVALAWEKPVKRDVLYCVSVGKDYGRVGVNAYSEFTVDHPPVALGYNYSTLGVSYELCPWMRASFSGGYSEDGGIRRWIHSLRVTQTFHNGDYTFWFREMCTHRRDLDTGLHSGLLRLRANAAYHIPDTAFSPYLATETYLWDEWYRTSVYAGTRVALSESITLSTYYMASFLQLRNMHH